MATQISDIADQLRRKEKDIKLIQERTERMEERVLKLEDEKEKQQILLRQDNIIFYGIPESVNKNDGGDCTGILIKLLNSHDTARTWREEDIAKAHRLGKKEDGQTRPRPVIAKLVRSREKRNLIASKPMRSELYKEGIRMNDDLTTTQRDKLKTLRDNGYTAFCRGTQVFSKLRWQTGKRQAGIEKTQNSDDDRLSDVGDAHQHILPTEEYPPLPPTHPLCPSDILSDHHHLTPSQDTERDRQHFPRSSSGGRGCSRGAGGSGDCHSAPRGFGRGRQDPADRPYDHPCSSLSTSPSDKVNDASPDLRPRTRNQTKPAAGRKKGESVSGQLSQGRIDAMMGKTLQPQ